MKSLRNYQADLMEASNNKRFLNKTPIRSATEFNQKYVRYSNLGSIQNIKFITANLNGMSQVLFNDAIELALRPILPKFNNNKNISVVNITLANSHLNIVHFYKYLYAILRFSKKYGFEKYELNTDQLLNIPSEIDQYVHQTNKINIRASGAYIGFRIPYYFDTNFECKVYFQVSTQNEQLMHICEGLCDDTLNEICLDYERLVESFPKFIVGYPTIRQNINKEISKLFYWTYTCKIKDNNPDNFPTFTEDCLIDTLIALELTK